MKIYSHKIVAQFHILPFIKVTYDKVLNGDYELIIGWFNIGISFSYTPKQIIKEEISKSFEGMEEPYVLLRVNSKNYGPMNNKLYSMGVNYEQISDDGIKVYTSKIDSNTLDSITNHPFVSSFKIIK